MKRFFIFLFIATNIVALPQKNNYIYDIDSNKLLFKINNDIAYFELSGELSDDDKKELLKTIKDRNISIENVSNNLYLVKQCNEMTDVFFERLMLKGRLSFFSHQLIYTKDSTIQWAGADIFVKVKKDNNISQLMKLLKVSYSNIRRWNDYCDDEFIITISSENALDCANRLYESGFFDYSQPSFFRKNIFQNYYYNYQWGLNNTGQDGGTSGIDINVEQAWNLSDGSGVIVALVDNGVDLTHPDIQANMLSGYDATGYASMGGYTNNDYHGTCCAGIICAKDNNIGIKGVAYNSHLIPIKMNSTTSFSYDTISTSAISFGCNNGASVISCSWGGGSGSAAITSAIIHFATTGRNDKGCVFVFSSGNNNMSSVEYPSNLDEVISVGAIDRCGARSGRIDIVPESCNPWDATCQPGSSYGEKLSVVAPGTNVYTTTINSNYTYFGGTSAACPHVAGVAALMLSVNPNLTAQEVRTIIEKTAQKVRPELYHYTDTVGHPNGTWNKYTGYGLVDAYAAVKVAWGYDLFTRDNNQDTVEPYNINTFVHDSPDIWLRRTADGGVEHQMAFNGTNYVYIKIHNRGPAPSMPTDSIRLYFRRAELQNSNNWYSNTWYYGGVAALPEIRAGDSVTVKIPVNISTYLQFDNFAFYTRIDSQYDTLRVPETSSTSNNIDFNNNISAKNTKITSLLIAEDNSGLDANFSVTNEPNTITSSKLQLRFSNGTSNILNEAEVTMIFPEDLMTDWTPSSESLKQITANTYLVTGESVELLDIPETDITLRYNFLTRRDKPVDIYKNHITQYVGSGEDEEIIGGLTIQVEKPVRSATDRFHANAGNDTAVLLNTTATLHATQINENATYRWYDKQRNFLYEGVNYSVVPSQTSEYILEVTAESDGYRDLDTVKVSVVPGCIRSITPNPVSDDWITVSYEYATTVTSAQLLIYNTGTTTLVGNYDLSNLGNVSSFDIEVTNYTTGSYTVVLVCDNTICHSKVLIRQ